MPVLVLLYPLTVVLILLGFLNNLFGGKKVVYVTTVVLTGVYSLYATITSTLGVSVAAVDNVLVKVLPLQGEFAWINFAVLGVVLGLLLSLKFKKTIND